MNILKKLLARTAWIVLLYFGFVEGIEGAKNVIIALAWFFVIFSPLLLLDGFIQDLAKRPAPPLMWLSHWSAGLTVVAFAWYNHPWLAGLYLLASVMSASALEHAALQRAKMAAKAMADA